MNEHVFPEFTISDILILCSTAAVEMGYFTNYEFQEGQGVSVLVSVTGSGSEGTGCISTSVSDW
jgi:hypothetical protein